MQTEAKRPIHVGRNIQRFRLLRGYSQGVLASMLEEKRKSPVNQQMISRLEESETIADEEILKQVAEILEVSPDALKHLDVESVITMIGNSFTANENAVQNQINLTQQSTFHQTNNQLDKLLEYFDKKETEWRKENQLLGEEIQRLRAEVEKVKAR